MTPELAALLRQLQHADAAQRSQAALQLGTMRESAAVAALVDLLCQDEDVHVLEDTTWALVRLGGLAVDSLLQVLAHENAKARHNAVHALGKIGDQRALDGLLAAAHDPAESVRYKAVYALGQLADPRAIHTLVGLLGDPVLDIQWLSRDVIATFGKAATPALLAALQPESLSVCELAVNLLGDLADRQAVEPLLHLLHSPDWQIRFAVIQALGQIGDRRAAPLLSPLTQDENPQVRAMAKQALITLS